MTDIIAMTNYADLKSKKGGGTGGFSDGNVVSLSKTIPPNGSVTFGPSAGKAWGGAGYAEDGNQHAANFDAAIDADVDLVFVEEDGTETLLEQRTIASGAPAVIDAYFDTFQDKLNVVAYPNKIRLKPTAGGTFPPAARVLYKGTFIEYDLPKDG